MSDQFVDDLFAKLHADREEALIRAASATRSRVRVAEAARAWWDEFSDIVERKVSAWNAKGAAGIQVSCTRHPEGSVVLWHHSVEAELRLAEPRVVMTGRIGDTRPRESAFVEFNEARGAVAAVLDNTPTSPTEAADHLLGPIFTRAFDG